MQKGVTLWFTGLSGSGKTTVALEVEKRLTEKGIKVERLDGDIVREYLTRDLGFSREDRDENIRRNSFVAKLLTQNGIITLCCFISPYRRARQEARELIGSFVEIYVNASLNTCEQRDVKGLYAQAREGKIPEFTGVSDPYEPPDKPEIELKTDLESVEESAARVISYLKEKGYIYPGKADLHLHTTASDGALDPAQLVCEARSAGFETIAITDHDTIDGVERALEAGKEEGIEVIPGLELSTLAGEDSEKEIHILGYYIDYRNKELLEILAKIIDARCNRALHMIEKLNQLGLEISVEQVKAIAGSEFIGRPHIAEAMRRKGYINDPAEAFSPAYIGRGGRAYVERFKISPQEAIELILHAGGIPVLAHPGYLSDRTALSEDDILPYLSSGLKGLEVYYSRHTLQQVAYYENIALSYNLLITGGSDCHGQSDYLLGTVKLSYKHVLALKEKVG